MIRFIAFFILFVLCSETVQAQRACTEMWCAEGFELALTGSAWPTGKYTFEIDADGKKAVCQSALPFTGCSGQTICDVQGVTIGESGCALSPDSHSFHSVIMPEIPAHISMKITHESGRTFDFSSAVEKSCSYPNGEGCDPKQCCSARVQADVKW